MYVYSTIILKSHIQSSDQIEKKKKRKDDSVQILRILISRNSLRYILKLQWTMKQEEKYA